jgi:protein tyrosine phosphatase
MEEAQSQVGRPVPVVSFREHIKKLFQTRHGIYGENGFDVEFNYIERKTERDNYLGDYKTAIQPYNHTKNRYSNVLPLEKTRVILSKDDTEGSDYINASYINGVVPGSEKAYICTQGPTKNTIDDFWRMIWEQNSSVVVMLTKEVENMTPKCCRYWPEEGQAESFGKYRVTLNSVENSGEIVIRTFHMEDNWQGERRTITHYQYTCWPDHGLPVSTTAFLDLIKLVDKQKKTGPVVVHCSAGIGRSGTFCTVHCAISKYKHDLAAKPDTPPSFDILHTVIHMRQQRPGMVQTKDQYMFCYLSIDEEASQSSKKFNHTGRLSLSYSH